MLVNIVFFGAMIRYAAQGGGVWRLRGVRQGLCRPCTRTRGFAPGPRFDAGNLSTFGAHASVMLKGWHRAIGAGTALGQAGHVPQALNCSSIPYSSLQ